MFFDSLPKAPPDPVFGLLKEYNLDPRENKHYLCIGIYQDEEGKFLNFPSVLKGQKILFENPRDASYLPFEGNHEFTDLLANLVFGKTLWDSLSHRVHKTQTLGGTGAIRIGMEFLFDQVTKKASYFEPSWPNHSQILKKVGMDVMATYYLKNEGGIDFDHLLDFVIKLPKKTVILLQPSCHNPTGCDPKIEQWKTLSKVFSDHDLIPFFDLAYQGLGESIDQDAYPVRLFAEEGHEMFVATTCSKTFGLYCQRVGALFVVTNHQKAKESVGSHVNRVIRTGYSNPPAFGADLVAQVLKNEELKRKWTQELISVRDRLKKLRGDFAHLMSEKSGHSFDFILQQTGMFSLIGLSESNISKLREKYGIYLSKNGRMNFAGLNQKNIEYIVDSILRVMG